MTYKEIREMQAHLQELRQTDRTRRMAKLERKIEKVSWEVGRQRLLLLADFLDKVPAQRFEFSHWASGPLKPEPSCGTTGCAMGWATQVPEFQALGLRLDCDAEEDGYDVEIHMVDANEKALTSDGFDSAMALFGIASHESDHLFMPGGQLQWVGPWEEREKLPEMLNAPDDDATPQAVADNIRRFVGLRDQYEHKQRMKAGLRELSMMTQEFGGYDSEREK